MLDLMEREHGLDRSDALALASVVVDLRVTQVVNQVLGVHAVLRDDAIRVNERLRLWLERGRRRLPPPRRRDGEPVRWEDPRIRVVAAAGVTLPAGGAARTRRSTRRAGSRSSPSRRTSTTRTRSAIWNEERTLQVGYVPAAVAPELAGDEQALSLWRVEGGLRVLIVPAGRLDRHAPVACSAPMAYEFKLPDLGEGLTEGEIARWLVTEGQELAEDDPLVEIATDKTTVEIPSPAAGTVTRILVAEGEVVPVGTVLVVIGGDGAEPAAAPAPERQPAPATAPSQAVGSAPGSRAGDAGRPPRRPGAGRRPGSAERHGAERAHHRGGRPQRRRVGACV